MVQEYEDNIRAPTPEFRGEPKIDDNIIPPPPKFRDEIKIAKVNKALKRCCFNHTRSALLMTKIRYYNLTVLASTSQDISNN